MYEKLEMLIAGEWCQGSTGATEEVINPATEEVIGTLPHASTEDLDRALDAAQKAFQIWRTVSAYDRAKILKKGADLIRERVDSIAASTTLEEGKPLEEARLETLFAADVLEWYAEEGRRAYGRVVPSRIRGARQLVVKEPVGPSALFTPWNFPITTPLRKIGAALAAGCSCIIKPSEEAPASCIGIARALVDAGVPAGALNVVFGVPAEVSQHLITSPVIKKVSLTGPVPVGRHLAKLAADGLKRVTMELGGHAPVLVFDDVDVDDVAQKSVGAKFRNSGQICIAPTRFFVHEAVYERFVERFCEIAGRLQVGDGMQEGTQMGPLANKRRLEAMEAMVADAEQRGARVALGGKRLGERGYFFAPTVLADVPDDARVMTDEPFGPIAPIVPFSRFDEVINRANSLPLGLAAYAFAKSGDTARALAAALEAGMVGINHFIVSQPEMPFGGVKESGYGSESGVEGLEAYLTPKVVTHVPTSDHSPYGALITD